MLKRRCKVCGKLFTPKGKYQKICCDCLKKINYMDYLKLCVNFKNNKR